MTRTSSPGTYTTTFTGDIAGSASTLTATVDGVQLASQPTIHVIPGAISGTMSSVSFASSMDPAGTSDIVNVVIEDAVGNAVTGLSSSAFDFSLSGGTSTGTFGPVSATSTPGTYSASFMGDIAGTANTVDLTVNGVTIDPPEVTVVPGLVSGSNSSVSLAGTTLTAGGTTTATIVVKDAAGNAITGLASSAFSFTFSGGTSSGSFGTVTETSTKGTYTVIFTARTAGTASALTVDINNVALAGSPKVTVKVGPVSGTASSLSFASSTVASGSTDAATITVKDAEGNPITGLASSAFVFKRVSGTSTGTMTAVTASATPGVYTATLTGVDAGTAETISVTVSGVAIATEPAVQVVPGPVSASRSTLSVAKTTFASGSTDTVTIAVKDANNNPIGGLTSSDFVFTISGGASTGAFGTVTQTSTPGTYTVLLTGVAAGSASTLTVTVNGVILATKPKLTVTPGPVNSAKSTVSVASPTVAVGATDTITITVEDAAGNPITGLSSSAVTFKLSGGTSQGIFGILKPTKTPGVYIVAFKAVTPGSACNLDVAVNGVALDTEPEIQVT